MVCTRCTKGKNSIEERSLSEKSAATCGCAPKVKAELRRRFCRTQNVSPAIAPNEPTCRTAVAPVYTPLSLPLSRTLSSSFQLHEPEQLKGTYYVVRRLLMYKQALPEDYRYSWCLVRGRGAIKQASKNGNQDNTKLQHDQTQQAVYQVPRYVSRSLGIPEPTTKSHLGRCELYGAVIKVLPGAGT